MKLISPLLKASEDLSTQRGLTALLIFLLFFIITVIPLAGFSLGKLLPHTIAILVLISGSLFVLPRGLQRLVTLTLALTAITLMWFSYFQPILYLFSLRSILIILVLGSIASATLSQVFRVEVEKKRNALADQTSLAYQRYYGGVTNYLEVLDSDQQLFDAELKLAQAQTNELLAVIALYRALGGGWQVSSQM